MAKELTGVRAALRALDHPKTGAKGTKAALARLIGTSRALVNCWGNVIPFRWLDRVQEVTGIPRDTLRPDWRAAFEREFKFKLPADVLSRASRKKPNGGKAAASQSATA